MIRPCQVLFVVLPVSRGLQLRSFPDMGGSAVEDAVSALGESEVAGMGYMCAPQQGTAPGARHPWLAPLKGMLRP